MYTFQILDCGEAFFFPLEGRVVTLGRADRADLRLRDAAVAEIHARIEPQGDRYRIVDLGGGVKVNETPTKTRTLVLGDRIEVGGAVLVLGRQVRRQATAKDIVEDARIATSRRPQAGRRVSRWLIGALSAAALVIAAVWLWLPGESISPPVIGELRALRRTGEFTVAQERIESLRHAGFARDPVLAEEERSLAATRAATDELRARILAEAAARTRAQQHDALRELEEQSRDAARREAARIVRIQLAELREHAFAATRRQTPAEAPAPPEVARRPDPVPVPSRPEPAATLEPLLTGASQLAAQGSFAQALEMLQQALETTPIEQAGPLRQRLASLRDDTRAAMAPLLEQARALAKEGKLEPALAGLRERAWQFPAAGDLAQIPHEIEGLERELAGRGPIPEGALIAIQKKGTQVAAVVDVEQRQRLQALLKTVLNDAQAAERAGELAKARELFREAAGRARSVDPAFGVDLEARAQTLGYLADLQAFVVPNFEPGKGPKLQDETGQELALVGPAGGKLRFVGAGGERLLAWSELPMTQAKSLLQRVQGPARAFLGLAVLAYRVPSRELAEQCLARAWELDAALRAEIQDLLRRERVDPPDPRGYELIAGRFVSLRSIEAEKKSKKIEERLARVVQQMDGKPGTAAEKLLEDLLAEGPDAVESVLLAFTRQQTLLAERIEKHTFRKSWDKLAQERHALDIAREYAKKLIFDEATYFYPYKAPAVDAKREAEYWPVQQEVDRRVAHVRELWTGSKTKLSVPTSLLDDARRFGWVTRVLVEFGEKNPETESKVAWVAALPADGKLDLQSFAVTRQERVDQDLWNRIEVFNQRLGKELSNEERAEFRITNEYRRMFNHRPLALNVRILAAARGHSEEMSKLGYFAHFSPTDGRKTPFDRMKLAGYAQGASENIALVDGAEAAHGAWLRSSGHHRNLLMPTHTEFAVGNSGRYWTQNFGRANEFNHHPEFPPAIGK